MDYRLASFRWGLEHLSSDNPEWQEIISVIESIHFDDVIEAKRKTFLQWRNGELADSKKLKKPPVGGQTILNELIHGKLIELAWEPQVYVLDETPGDSEPKSKSKRLNYWSMDFKKDLIGIEVSFNNAGVLAQNLLRLSVMAENIGKSRDRMIRLGILITATDSMKKWSNMDSTVLTYESVCRVMPQVNLNIPTPIVLVGLNNSENNSTWAKTDLFGHKKLPDYNKLSAAEKSYWNRIMDSL